MKLGDFLVKMIFWSGMSQAEVARKCGISTLVLNDLVKNRRGINVRYAKSFEDLFGVPTRDRWRYFPTSPSAWDMLTSLVMIATMPF